jgi:hypothetical protein
MMMGRAAESVDVVPSRVNNAPVVRDARVPFVRFVIADRVDL